MQHLPGYQAGYHLLLDILKLVWGECLHQTVGSVKIRQGHAKELFNIALVIHLSGAVVSIVAGTTLEQKHANQCHQQLTYLVARALAIVTYRCKVLLKFREMPFASNYFAAELLNFDPIVPLIATGRTMLIESGGILNSTAGSELTINGAEGADQIVIVPNSEMNRYHTLILSGTGTKTMPVTPLSITVDLIMVGSASATAPGTICTYGKNRIAAGFIISMLHRHLTGTCSIPEPILRLVVVTSIQCRHSTQLKSFQEI